MTRNRRRIISAGTLALASAFLVLAPLGLKPYGIFILSMWAVMTIAAIGLNLTLGYAGQISLAQAAFVGIGAYITGWLTTKGAWPFWPTYFLGFASCFAVGWVLGYPALRVQHHYLAFVTLAFNTLVYLAFRNEEWLTNGIYGISNVPRPSLFGYSLKGAKEFYYFCLAHLVFISAAAWWLIRSPWGRAFVAVRENPVRALSLGVDVRRYTLMAFAIGAGLALLPVDGGDLLWSGLRGAPRDFFQGLIQAAVAFYHLGNGNRAGAQSVLGRSLSRLERFPARYSGVEVEPLRVSLRAFLAALEGGGALPAEPPRIERVAGEGA